MKHGSQDTGIEGVLGALAATPVRLMELTDGVGTAKLAARASADEWSARDIVAHLRANADAWGGTIRRMLAEDRPAIRYISPRGALKKPEYADRSFGESLDLLVEGRRELLGRLGTLAPGEWSRGAEFTGTTRQNETVFDYARNIASHEAAHLVQLELLLRA